MPIRVDHMTGHATMGLCATAIDGLLQPRELPNLANLLWRHTLLDQVKISRGLLVAVFGG